jgi:hypothetical protein
LPRIAWCDSVTVSAIVRRRLLTLTVGEVTERQRHPFRTTLRTQENNQHHHPVIRGRHRRREVLPVDVSAAGSLLGSASLGLCRGVAGVSPFHQWLEGFDEVGAAFGEVVSELHRGRGDYVAFDQFRRLQFTHPFSEHPIGQARTQCRDLTEPGGAAGKGQQDRRTPAFADQFDGGLEVPAPVVVDVVPGSGRYRIVSRAAAAGWAGVMLKLSRNTLLESNRSSALAAAPRWPAGTRRRDGLGADRSRS